MTRDYYQQHHQLEAPQVDRATFRPFWRRVARIDTLLRDQSIAPIVWRAAVAYRTLAEHAAASDWRGRQAGDSRVDERGWRSERMVDRASARQELEAVRRTIGGFATRMVEAVVVEELPWARLGRRMGVDPKTARAWSITALQLLPAAMFRAPDQKTAT